MPTHALWVGDFEEGPYVLYESQPVRTHLSAFIDCHSRYVVTARYDFRQTLDVPIDTLLRAWAALGASHELYVDDAKVYDANALKAACLALNIKLLHRPPRDAAPGGLIVEQHEQSQEKTIPAIAFELKVAIVHRYRHPLSLSGKSWRTEKGPVRDRPTRTGDDSG